MQLVYRVSPFKHLLSLPLQPEVGALDYLRHNKPREDKQFAFDYAFDENVHATSPADTA